MRFTTDEHNGRMPPADSGSDRFEDAKALNSFLRGEISAAEAYDLAIGKFEGGPAVIELRQIRDEHHSAMGMLREQILAAGAMPVESSGAWGALTTLITGTALALGDKPVLSALRRGEERGISAYRHAADSTNLSYDCRSAIAGALLPMCRRHVATLEQLSASLT